MSIVALLQSKSDVPCLSGEASLTGHTACTLWKEARCDGRSTTRDSIDLHEVQPGLGYPFHRPYPKVQQSQVYRDSPFHHSLLSIPSHPEREQDNEWLVLGRRQSKAYLVTRGSSNGDGHITIVALCFGNLCRGIRGR